VEDTPSDTPNDFSLNPIADPKVTAG
jgi:hypothetical protein